ncbi:phosphatidylserine/phosphatidylglycerophosphate/cardiolipin synthase family protein [Paenibacillus psychroresistens]|uniref:Phosphatidylserine/phosphatidylglycerophosphate/ cardiolipin synthase family protein n=1 Tax=Paenibacillus psychroresistens TaxID=1778678 RepID=A0A6B8RGQ8_9BACL|nr:phosphatidylserine/phosphatidylglycerophosphate/cardiolipin synthase family protein [Paenibacillus psychroresistens]QGQ94775.1 phosphatidylserine/phosphatidylglycerophosphate/cardiolipin synthase family protein [Paenibacillus psychroresistens]
MIIDLMNYIMAKGPLGMIMDHEEPLSLSITALSNDEAVMNYRQALGGVFSLEAEVQNMPGMNRELMQAITRLANDVNQERLRVLTPKTTFQNQVDAYLNGPDCLTMILDEIQKAEHYIHLSVMLYFNDLAGNLITAALLQALARGVEVRVMVDYGVTEFGYSKKPGVGDFSHLADQLKAAGGQVINCFNSCYESLDWEKKRAELHSQGVSEGVLFLQDLVQAAVHNDLDVINHRKFIVIDGTTSIIGSLNIGDQYLYDNPVIVPGVDDIEKIESAVPYGKAQWHDGCFRIRGAFALPLNQLFASQWVILSDEVFDPEDAFYSPAIDQSCGNEACTLLVSFPGNPVNTIRHYYADLITYAAGEVIISNPYMLDPEFWQALQGLNAAQSSRITLCNSMIINDHPTNEAAVRCNMYQPFEQGVAFFDYSKTGRFSHWKVAYDKNSSCVFHGSYNLNIRSACHDFEAGVLVRGQDFAEKVRELLQVDLKLSERVVDGNVFHKYPWIHPSNYFNEMTRYFT